MLYGAHNGSAYAVLHLNEDPNIKAVIETVSASGHSCGTSTFGRGGTRVGYDGTVVQSVTPLHLYPMAEFDCRWEWWPGFFH